MRNNTNYDSGISSSADRMSMSVSIDINTFFVSVFVFALVLQLRRVVLNTPRDYAHAFFSLLLSRVILGLLCSCCSCCCSCHNLDSAASDELVDEGSAAPRGEAGR